MTPVLPDHARNPPPQLAELRCTGCPSRNERPTRPDPGGVRGDQPVPRRTGLPAPMRRWWPTVLAAGTPSSGRCTGQGRETYRMSAARRVVSIRPASTGVTASPRPTWRSTPPAERPSAATAPPRRSPRLGVQTPQPGTVRIAPGTDPAGIACLTDRGVFVAAHKAARLVSAQKTRAKQVIGHLRANGTGNAFVTVRRRQHRVGPAEQSAIGDRQRSGTAMRPVRSCDTGAPRHPDPDNLRAERNAVRVGVAGGRCPQGPRERIDRSRYRGTHGAQERTRTSTPCGTGT